MTQQLSRRTSARRLGYLATVVALAVLAIVVIDAMRTSSPNQSQPTPPFAADSVRTLPLRDRGAVAPVFHVRVAASAAGLALRRMDQHDAVQRPGVHRGRVTTACAGRA